MRQDVKVKVTIGKLIDVAYSRNKGLTAAVLKSKGNLKLTVDTQGHAVLSGDAGMVVFKADSALKELGAKVKNVSILFSKGKGDFDLNYTAMVSFFGAASISTSGAFNLEKLLLSCSGLLCIAARSYRNSDQKIREAMIDNGVNGY